MSDVQNNETRLLDAKKLLKQYFQLLADKDLDGWMNLLDDNCVMEFPFAPQGRPDRIEGKAIMYPYIQGILNSGEFVRIKQQEIYLTQYPDTIIVESEIEIRVHATGDIYSRKYVWIMKTKDGKLIYQKDYWNPTLTFTTRGAQSNEKTSTGNPE